MIEIFKLSANKTIYVCKTIYDNNIWNHLSEC